MQKKRALRGAAAGFALFFISVAAFADESPPTGGAAVEGGPGCRVSPLVVAPCFWIEGTLRVHDGWPPGVRIEVKDSVRELGVGPGEIGILPAAVAERLPARVDGDFEVCPFGETIRLPYHRAEDSAIEMVCVEQVANATVTRWDVGQHAEINESLGAPQPSSPMLLAPSPVEAENTRVGSMAEEKIRLYTRAIDSGAVRGRPLGLMLWERGVLQSSLSRLEPAQADLERAAVLVPELALVDLGVLFAKRHSFERAIEVLDRAIARDPAFGRPYRQRAWVRFFAGDFAGAVTDLRQHLATSPSDRYAWLWLYLAEARAGGDPRDDLARAARGQDLAEWPGPLVSLFVGRLGPDEVIARMPRVTSDRLDRRTSCEAFFFLGERALLAHDEAYARELFERTRATGVTSFVEHASAELELERLP